jgi:Protein of unknown function (DUF3618)
MTAEMTDNRSEEAMIERDIEHTQDEMGETVQKLEDSLTPKEMARSVIGDDGTDFAREALEIVRQNPIPAAMIAVGAIWLLATARTPGMRRMTDRLSGSRSSNLRPRSAEPAPIGPPPGTDPELDRRPGEAFGSTAGGPF